MKANFGYKIFNKYILKNIFEYLSLESCLKIIKYNKALHNKLQFDYNLSNNLYKMKMIIKLDYEYLNKYINYFLEEKKKKKITNQLTSKNLFFTDINLFYKGINSMPGIILIDISENKNWKLFVENFNNIKLEINPSVIHYLKSLNNKDLYDVLEHLKKHRNNIKEIYFNSFKESNEINLETQKIIKIILNGIFSRLKTNYANNYCFVNKISFKDNSIISILDINNLFIDISSIIYNKSLYCTMEQLYIDSKTVNHDIINIKNFINEKMYNLKKIHLNDFNFINDNNKGKNNNISILSNLFKKLKYLERIDLGNSKCNNQSLISIFDNDNLLLKEIKFQIIYGDKMVNWNFLDKYFNTLEVLEIKMVFPYSGNLMTDKIFFNYKYNNIKDLFSIINKMKKLQNLKLIGDHLNYYNLKNIKNDNKIIDLTYNFHTIKPKKTDYLEKYFKELKTISLINLKGNNTNKNNKEPENKKAIFQFPENLSVLNFTNFTDNNFLKSYLIPLLNENKNKLKQIKKIKINNCFLDIKYFEEFLSILPLMENLLILSINNIIFYKEFLMEHLLNFLPKIFVNARNLLELDLSNNKFEEKIFLDYSFLALSFFLPKNLISLRLFNNKIPISQKAIKTMEEYFGYILDLENIVEI